MVLLTCRCLNIQVHTRGPEIKKLDPNSLNLTAEQLKDNFFSKDIANVVLDICGITKEQPYLVESYTVGEWIIHTCISCSEVVYAAHIHQGVDHLLVNIDLKTDSTRVKEMMLSNDYSPLFKIKLQKRDDNRILSCHDFDILKNQQSRSLEAAISAIQQQITKYLQTEQKSMDERIRKFTDQQNNEFSILRAQVQQEKSVVMSLLLSAEEKSLSEALNDAMLDHPDFTPPVTPLNSTDDNIITPSSLTKIDNVENLHPKQDKNISLNSRPMHLLKGTSLKSKRKPQLARNRIAMSLDTDAIFPIDGLHDDLSSSRSSEENENEECEDNYGVTTKPRPHPVQISASLPMAIPHGGFMAQKQEPPPRRFIDYEDEDKVPDDPAEMVASIKAMSMSVHNTEMFGELPPPRVYNNSPNK